MLVDWSTRCHHLREVTRDDVLKSAAVGAVSGYAGDKLQGLTGHSSPNLSTLNRANTTTWTGDQVLGPALLGSGVELPMTVLLDIREQQTGGR